MNDTRVMFGRKGLSWQGVEELSPSSLRGFSKAKTDDKTSLQAEKLTQFARDSFSERFEEPSLPVAQKKRSKTYFKAFLCLVFLGNLGGHRFYLQRTLTALMMFIMGAFNLGALFFSSTLPQQFLLLSVATISLNSLWIFIDMLRLRRLLAATT